MTIKQAYFQGGGGVNEPTPNQQKYPTDQAIVVQPRFEEPLYFNYDYLNVPGQYGPGSGYAHMNDYKSVKDFLAARRQRMKNKYVADDAWIPATTPSIKIRASIYQQLITRAIDFPIDDQVNHYDQMIYTEEDEATPQQEIGGTDLNGFPSSDGAEGYSSYTASIPFAVNFGYTPNADVDGKTPDALDYENDLTTNEHPAKLTLDDLKGLIEKYLTPSETGLMGLPDGIDHDEFNQDQTLETQNPYFGTTDVGTQPYGDKWNI